MKKLIFVSIAIMVMSGIRAQSYIPTKEDIKTFFHTKTLVVLSNNPLREYNLVIQEVMKQEWTITPFEFISESEFDEKRMDPQYSFIYMAQVSFENDKTDAIYRFLHLSLGGDYFRKNQMPDIAAVPVAYYNVEEDQYAYKLALLVRFMQNHALLIKDNPNLISQNVFKHYNDNIKDMKGKTLYLLENELSKNVNSAARIKKVYDGKFKIVTKDEIKTAIKERDENVVFLHKVGPEGTKINARCYKIIVGAADAQFYYFDYHKINKKMPDGFLEKDFKKIVVN